MYVKIVDGAVDQYPYTVGKLRKDNSNTSFPKRMSDDALASWGVYPVSNAADPDYDSATQKIQNASEPTLVDGAWVLAKTVVALTDDEIAANTAAAEQAVRAKRDGLLAETDWTGLSDVTMSADMTTYRQALRDITTHANFPNLADSDWPTKPE